MEEEREGREERGGVGKTCSPGFIRWYPMPSSGPLVGAESARRNQAEFQEKLVIIYVFIRSSHENNIPYLGFFPERSIYIASVNLTTTICF